MSDILLTALNKMIEDLENNGEVFGSDRARINYMTDAIMEDAIERQKSGNSKKRITEQDNVDVRKAYRVEREEGY